MLLLDSVLHLRIKRGDMKALGKLSIAIFRVVDRDSCHSIF